MHVPGEDLVDCEEFVLILNQRTGLGMQILCAKQLGLLEERPVHVAKHNCFQSLGEKLRLDLGSLVHSCVSEGLADLNRYSKHVFMPV